MSKEYKEIDGFKIPMKIWDEIKEGYVNIPSAYENEVMEEAFNVARNAVMLIDKEVGVDEYTPEAASDEMYDIAHNFANDALIQQVLNGDEIMTARLLEVLCGINNPQTENKIKLIINKAAEMINEIERRLWH
jgi:uncharacterized protein YjgD (DUF1641 family)